MLFHVSNVQDLSHNLYYYINLCTVLETQSLYLFHKSERNQLYLFNKSENCKQLRERCTICCFVKESVYHTVHKTKNSIWISHQSHCWGIQRRDWELPGCWKRTKARQVRAWATTWIVRNHHSSTTTAPSIGCPWILFHSQFTLLLGQS